MQNVLVWGDCDSQISLTANCWRLTAKAPLQKTKIRALEGEGKFGSAYTSLYLCTAE